MNSHFNKWHETTSGRRIVRNILLHSSTSNAEFYGIEDMETQATPPLIELKILKPV